MNSPQEDALEYLIQSGYANELDTFELWNVDGERTKVKLTKSMVQSLIDSYTNKADGNLWHKKAPASEHFDTGYDLGYAMAILEIGEQA